MAKRVRSLYQWSGGPEEGLLERTGVISEARLRAWEYRPVEEDRWEYFSGSICDTVRPYRTSRPDLPIPETLFVGDNEEKEN